MLFRSIMLLGVDRAEDLQVEPMRVQRPLAVVLGLSVAGLVGAAVIASRDVAPGRVGGGLEVALPDGSRTHDGNIRALARDVFSDHVLAFELTSVLLVIAVVATVMLARKPRKGETLLDANGGAA